MNLRNLRAQKGVSQSELARYLGVARSTVCQYEANRREPDNETLSKLADYFGVTVDYILGREESRSPCLRDFAQRRFDLNAIFHKQSAV